MIPWVALLKHAPAIAVAADALLARARSSGDPGPNANTGERLDRLEQGYRESAELLQDMARQINVLTLAQAKTAQRVRITFALSIAAVVLAAVACVLLLLRA